MMPPDLSDTPPGGLVAAQHLAIELADFAAHSAEPGMTEIELHALTERQLRARGGTGVWSPTTIGFGRGTLECFPTQTPTDRQLWPIDLGIVDVHPVTAGGWWGDCTRTFMRGDNPGYASAMREIRRIHEQTLAAARPGMRAADLFGAFADALAGSGFVLLDRLNNIGHSLSRGEAYDDGYLDPWNETELWGAWAVEPYVGTHLWGVKLEDVIWLGSESVHVLGRRR
jgi:Xaa-Pro aminopeptidase